MTSSGQNKIYGAWIRPDGEVIYCPDKCSHIQYCRYQDAHDEGWVGAIFGAAVWSFDGAFGDCFFFNMETATKKALREAKKMIQKSDEKEFHLADIWRNDYPGFHQGASRRKAMDFVSEVIAERK